MFGCERPPAPNICCNRFPKMLLVFIKLTFVVDVPVVALVEVEVVAEKHPFKFARRKIYLFTYLFTYYVYLLING